jgi:hypothetical protein
LSYLKMELDMVFFSLQACFTSNSQYSSHVGVLVVNFDETLYPESFVQFMVSVRSSTIPLTLQHASQVKNCTDPGLANKEATVPCLLFCYQNTLETV